MSSSHSRTDYDKQWCSIDDQLALLADRGLVIDNKDQAKQFLSHIGYYRLSGYCLAFEKRRHEFIAGTTSTAIKDSYLFDVKLRDAVTDALEVIEVDARSNIAHIFTSNTSAFGHLDANNFKPRFRHDDWLTSLQEEAERSKEKFVIHYQGKYNGFPDLPYWMATEIASFGSVSKMYAGLKPGLQKPIASRYNMQQQDFDSALHHLCYIRNICAHHGRLWDREWAIQPRLPAGKNWEAPLLPDKSRLFVTLLMISRVIKGCKGIDRFAIDWRRRVSDLIKEPPKLDDAMARMGLTEKWYQHPYWR